MKIFKRLHEYFVVGPFQGEWDLRKKQLLVSISIISSLYALAFLPLVVIEDYMAAAPVIGLFSAAMILIPFLVRMRIPVELLAHFYITAIWLAEIRIMMVSGGVYQNITDPQILVLMPVMALLFTGLRAAIVWLIVAMLTIVVFAVLQMNGIEFTPRIDPQYLQFQQMLAVVGHLLLIFLVINVFEQLKNEAHRKLSNQNVELEMKGRQLQEALDSLKASQEQLVRQEKLASLGQLTAGVAHEIQNPLNFVNNFSEVSAELIGELRVAVSDDERRKLADLLEQNIKKIEEHGKRADGIVKSMLLHSHGGSQDYSLTDLNSLCTDYVNLAYQAIRAGDSAFTCEIVQDFDDRLPRVKVVQEQIGRVLLNLLNNALQSVRERQKREPEFAPRVMVTTSFEGSKVVMSVLDNGGGVPADLRERIFEPFFTTKPAGSGTGLGLSISYDIVKAHRGELLLSESKNGTAEFKVILPA